MVGAVCRGRSEVEEALWRFWLRVIEAVVARRLKWLVVVVAFVVKRSGKGCCGDFYKVL